MDQDSTFMLSLINYLFNELDIKIKTIINLCKLSTEVNHYQ